MRAAWMLTTLLLAVGTGGCLGVDNMAEFKATLGFAPEPLEALPPVARAQASLNPVQAGQAVTFTADRSLDPQGLPLAYAWSFGDGERAEGREVSHRYRAPGLYTVDLRATNRAGLEGLDQLLVTVVLNRAPTAQLTVLKGGEATARALVGDELVFQGAATDPDGDTVSLRWDFGDGSGAITPEARHRYAHGGRYLVALRAEDPSGLAGTASQALAVDQVFAGFGHVAVPTPRSESRLEVAAGVQQVLAKVHFPAMYGLHGLTAQLVDAKGSVVAQRSLQPPPLTQGTAELVLDASGHALADRAPGQWGLVVLLSSGLQVDYDFTVEVRY